MTGVAPLSVFGDILRIARSDAGLLADRRAKAKRRIEQFQRDLKALRASASVKDAVLKSVVDMLLAALRAPFVKGKEKSVFREAQDALGQP